MSREQNNNEITPALSTQHVLIAQFREVSGAEEDIARLYLINNNWSIEVAMSRYLGDENNFDEIAVGNSCRNRDEVSSLNNYMANLSVGTGNDADEDFKPKAKPRFASLSDIKPERSSESDEGQAFYVGGSGRSGQQVLGPPSKDVFKKEQKVEESPTASTSAAARWGQGVRLGRTNNDQTIIPAPNADNATSPVMLLNLWQNGFSIDDGGLRSYDDPDNNEFLETIMRGDLPPELLRVGRRINLEIVDRRSRNYQRPNLAQVFSGSGHTLGSPTPQFAGFESPQRSRSTVEDTANAENTATEGFNLNAGAPTTRLQIRLADGTILTGEFNTSHTVADIYQYIQFARPEYAGRGFVLVTPYPAQELSDPTATIAEADLQNASIMQIML